MRLIVLMLVGFFAAPVATSADEAKSRTVASMQRFARAAAAPTPLRDAIRQRTSRAMVIRATPQDFRRAERADNWIRRHPACFGSIVGFIAGFAIGFLPGDDGVFYDFDASFNGLVIGGIGAGVGAIAGAIIGR